MHKKIKFACKKKKIFFEKSLLAYIIRFAVEKKKTKKFWGKVSK